MILFTFVMVPVQVNTLLQIIAERNKFMAFYRGYQDHPMALVVCGNTCETMPALRMRHFLRAFFDPLHPNWNSHVVILHPQPPSLDVQRIMHTYEGRVHYIIGSALNAHDRKRAAMSRAVVCYVLMNPLTNLDHHSVHDAQMHHAQERMDQNGSILTAICRRTVHSNVPILAEVAEARNARHCFYSGASTVVCMKKIHMAILAQSSRMVGLSTLLSNLISTIAPATALQSSMAKTTTERGSRAAVAATVAFLKGKSGRASVRCWKHAYFHGYQHEIHKVEIPSTFAGLNFGELVLFLFVHLKIVCFALHDDVCHSVRRTRSIYLSIYLSIILSIYLFLSMSQRSPNRRHV
jgi:hypothetical protein